MKLRKEQREVLVGILLGDAHLETQNKRRTYRLKVEHSIKEKDYAYHLWEIFRDWCESEPKIRERTYMLKGETFVSRMIVFETISHASFRFYAHQFYDKESKKKVVPKLIHRFLKPRSLAYWFMDNGSVKSGEHQGLLINTQSFSRREQEILVEALKRNFDVDVMIHKDGYGKYRLYMDLNESKKFIKLIEPYIHPSMMYKIRRAKPT